MAASLGVMEEAPESRVLIIITGGTICMKPSADGLVPATGFLKTGLAPQPSFNDGSYPEPLEIAVDDAGTRKAVQSLRTPISTYHRRVRYSVYEFPTLLDSSSIDATGWDLIARSIQRNYQLFDGFVILHGTDSLAYTCSALSFMLNNLGKPVILTGSQAPMLSLQTDATDNLLNSLIIAGHFMIPEVCLFFNFALYRGNRTTKTSSDSFAAFASPNHPPLATVSATRTHVNWDLIVKPTAPLPFHISTSLSTAHVACLRVFPGILPEMLDAVLRLPSLQGLILETFGAGNTPGGPDGTLTRVLAAAVQRGIVIVNVTQCLSGSVSALYASGTALGRAGIVFGQDLTTEAALTKLSYLLAQEDATPESVAREMARDLCGELTERGEVAFAHPGREKRRVSGALTPEVESLTALGYRIQEGDLDGVKGVMREERGWLLGEGDYAGNTPMHIASLSPHPQILSYLLASGGSVHLRNRAGFTPLFLAAQAGLQENVALLREAGAHLHGSEIGKAKACLKELGKGPEGEKEWEREERERRRGVWEVVGAEGAEGYLDRRGGNEQFTKHGDGCLGVSGE
ncbi:asparaginase-domain-containing protein [Eremomyces bilateralis CBS 781.70]|uniref:asparaginase n=1 Tax=Eremomyces bilateralis CBS 781.70 TaxID=1392243 RepID=A0A6G1G7G8_9PEZI|nr:asparaginase-domain-containing protein [Eremomyces bilateralis CBS 781.70]KAF1814035.1 asparaginase-domain-containing protein [Eremomyces bilateralis CBS 781.70]